MDVIVLDQNFNQIAVIDYCASVIWTERYCANGDLELYLPADSESLNYLKANNLVMRPDKPESLMVIKTLTLSTDAEGGDYITVTGVGIAEYLGRRIVWEQTTLTGKPVEIAVELVRLNAVNPLDGARKVPNLEIGVYPDQTAEITKQSTGTNLLDAIVELLEGYELGFRVVYRNEKLIFEIYKGSRVPVYFSYEFDNIITSEYIADVSIFKNVCMVQVGTDIRDRAVVGDAEGLNRFEMFADGDSLSGDIISEDEFKNIMEQYGRETLEGNKATEEFEATVDPIGNFVFGKDYCLGDIVGFENEYGIRQIARITEVIECWDENGYSCNPTFSSTAEVE